MAKYINIPNGFIVVKVKGKVFPSTGLGGP
jgi:hypothetical protein